MKSIPELIGDIQSSIESLDLAQDPTNLYDPMRYILGLGGKRMRPLLVLLAYQLKGGEVDSAVEPSLAVEIFHNFTLMHDDIMDGAPLRRGQPTVHTKWNNTVAILSGDAMFVKAYDQLLKADASVLARAIARFNQTAIEVCEGQQLDMDFESEDHVTESQYLEMIRLKTAVLLGYSLELGGLLAGMDESSQQKLYEVGENMGLGFQLMDDYLDVYADQSKFGKQVGGDIISNKKTYLLINALEMANGEQLDSLNSWIAKTEFDPEEKVEAVREIYDNVGIGNLAKMKMNDYFNKAFSILDELEGDNEAKKLFIEFAKSLINREK